jgi:hypothetical protein
LAAELKRRQRRGMLAGPVAYSESVFRQARIAAKVRR